jgi:teichuronic acid biosynthesis glycosyltransferase TuaC
LIKEGMNVRLVSVHNSDNREMPWYYSAADAMILCSSREGSPTSIKEALACNLPVVSTDVGDVREILNGIPGTRICSGEISDIARNLKDVIGSSRNSGFDGRAKMLKYDQGRTVEEIVNVYKQVLGTHTGKAKKDSCVA